MNEEKVRAMVENIEELLAAHDRQRDNYMKLFKICLKHLKDRRRLIPMETWDERQQLIDALESLTMLAKEQKHE